MVLKVEHEIHDRRKGRNMGVGLLLIGVIGIVFGLTVVKVLGLTETTCRRTSCRCGGG